MVTGNFTTSPNQSETAPGQSAGDGHLNDRQLLSIVPSACFALPRRGPFGGSSEERFDPRSRGIVQGAPATCRRAGSSPLAIPRFEQASPHPVRRRRRIAAIRHLWAPSLTYFSPRHFRHRGPASVSFEDWVCSPAQVDDGVTSTACGTPTSSMAQCCGAATHHTESSVSRPA